MKGRTVELNSNLVWFAAITGAVAAILQALFQAIWDAFKKD